MCVQNKAEILNCMTILGEFQDNQDSREGIAQHILKKFDSALKYAII